MLLQKIERENPMVNEIRAVVVMIIAQSVAVYLIINAEMMATRRWEFLFIFGFVASLKSFVFSGGKK